jgi:membrane protein implicated in regulation of membrane protease activity
MELSPSIIWLLAGSILIVFEVTLLSGVGLLFAGLSAISVGIALIAGWIESPTVQFITFFLITGFWAAALWKPLKNFMKSPQSGFDDMIGSIAIVFGNPIKPGQMGKVKWSGTIMKCKFILETEEKFDLAPGTEVTIVEVSNGILIVRPNS